jgi:hypothetical protein
VTSSNCAGGGGGIYATGPLSVTNSTLTFNHVTCAGTSCTANGGGVLAADVTITSATLDSNYVCPETCAGGGAGGNVGSVGSGGSVKLVDTILTETEFTSRDCGGLITDLGHNLADDSTCGLTAANNDVVTPDPHLGGLADNGGPTKTIALLSGSPAISAGGTCPAADMGFDQRGTTRKTACDIGAYETPLMALTVALSGSGTVAGLAPNAFTCQPTCTPAFLSGTTVTVQEHATAGSFFSGWPQADCDSISADGKQCTVTITAPRTVHADFEPIPNVTLQVIPAGTGTGTVTDTAPGGTINCGSTCSHAYPSGTRYSW